METLDLTDLNSIIDLLLKAYKSGNQVFIMGNGGSAAIASHFACDLGKGTLKDPYDEKEKRLKVISLTDNVPLMTAYSNDLAYEHVFSQQLKNLLNAGDVVIGISSSGNSKNVLNAIELAKKNKATTIGFVGFDGGKLIRLVDYKIWVNKSDYGIVEDTHSIMHHMICAIIRERTKK